MKRFLTLAAAFLSACGAKVPQAGAQQAIGEVAHGSVVGVRRLNNFVTELLNLSPPPTLSGSAWKFNTPRGGWVFVRSTADLRVGGKKGMMYALKVGPRCCSFLIGSQPGRGTGRGDSRLGREG